MFNSYTHSIKGTLNCPNAAIPSFTHNVIDYQTFMILCRDSVNLELVLHSSVQSNTSSVPKKSGFIFFGFVYAENNLILSYFIF